MRKSILRKFMTCLFCVSCLTPLTQPHTGEAVNISSNQSYITPAETLIERTILGRALQSKPISYSDYIGEFEFTAYEVGGVCANGMPAEPGVVAVDPYIIPLGSLIYIEVDGLPQYNGTYVAADTGGAVCGNIIDICMYSGHEEFGRRYGRAYFLTR